MNKFPIQYLDVLPYSIRETGFHEERKQVSESLFSISNEYRGIRGRMDEGGSFDHTLRGVYFNGNLRLCQRRHSVCIQGYREKNSLQDQFRGLGQLYSLLQWNKT